MELYAKAVIEKVIAMFVLEPRLIYGCHEFLNPKFVKDHQSASKIPFTIIIHRQKASNQMFPFSFIKQTTIYICQTCQEFKVTYGSLCKC